jgi:branched-subunit amino acid transport protein AzlD
MSWWTIAVLAAGAYAFKAIGLLAFEGHKPSAARLRALGLLPPALLGALIVVQTVADGTTLAVDARLAGVAAGAAVATWRRAPFLLVLVVAAATTALVRAWG